MDLTIAHFYCLPELAFNQATFKSQDGKQTTIDLLNPATGEPYFDAEGNAALDTEAAIKVEKKNRDYFWSPPVVTLNGQPSMEDLLDPQIYQLVYYNGSVVYARL